MRLQSKLKMHESTLQEHFVEEEALGPQLRSTFTYSEYRAVTQIAPNADPPPCCP